MKRVNGTGVILLFICMGVMTVFAVMDYSFAASLSVGCVVMSLADAGLRLRSNAPGKQKWLTGGKGGIFGRMPVWILGIVLLILLQSGVLEWLVA